MTYNSSKADPSIFQGGKLKPGVYKIQNIVSKTYVDIKDHVRELCGRPSTALENGRGQWEIQPLGAGYTIRKTGPGASGRPDQFCIMLNGMNNECAVSVAEFPVAWKIEVVKDAQYRGFEYVRIIWGSTKMVWDLAGFGNANNGTKVRSYKPYTCERVMADVRLNQIQVMDNGRFEACRIWELIPVKVNNSDPRPSSSSAPPRDSSPLPSYEGNTGTNCCTCFHHRTEPSDDGFGTTVIEVTTVTTRKKYRVEDQ